MSKKKKELYFVISILVIILAIVGTIAGIILYKKYQLKKCEEQLREKYSISEIKNDLNEICNSYGIDSNHVNVDFKYMGHFNGKYNNCTIIIKIISKGKFECSLEDTGLFCEDIYSYVDLMKSDGDVYFDITISDNRGIYKVLSHDAVYYPDTVRRPDHYIYCDAAKEREHYKSTYTTQTTQETTEHKFNSKHFYDDSYDADDLYEDFPDEFENIDDAEDYYYDNMYD